MSNEKTIQKFVIRPTTDHDKKVKFSNHTFLCFTEQQLDLIHPDGDYTVVGETADKSKAKRIGMLIAGEEHYPVSAFKTHNRLLFAVSGYVKVGEGEYVALLHNRLLFLILLFAGVLLLIALLAAMVGSLQPEDPVIIDPDHPLPTEDGNAEVLPDDPDSQRPDVPEGGGSISMVYTLEAEISLSTGEISIYFQNPAASTHDVSLIFYIVSGDQAFPIAQSGLLKAGYGLNVMTVAEGTVQLREGVYEGKYVLSLFDPATGERALVQPEITGVNVTVVP